MDIDFDFAPCVCHNGCSWDIQDLTDDGHCPQYFYERLLNEDGTQ